jgi:hypothetical protein
MTLTKRTILAILLCLPTLAQARSQAAPPMPASTPYVVFIHSGPKQSDDPVVKRLAVMLAKQGYSVREPENDQDKVGGPGVDYFADQAKAKAQELADAVNGYLGPLGQDASKKLQPRKQSGKSPPNYLGIWLY